MPVASKRTEHEWNWPKHLIVVSTIVAIGTVASHAIFLLSLPVRGGDTPIQEFVIGRWQGTSQNAGHKGTERRHVELEFRRDGLLIVDLESDTSTVFGALFEYQFLTAGRLVVRGRGSTQWNLAVADGHLIVTSKAWPIEGSIIYDRRPDVDWRSISIALGALPLGAALIALRYRRLTSAPGRGLVGAKDFASSVEPQGVPAHTFLLVLIAASLLAGNWLAHIMWWSWPPFQRISFPWESVIKTEVSSSALILGVTLLLASRRYLWVPRAKTANGLALLGGAAAGFGALPFLTGIGSLLTYFILGPQFL
jgi:hypothetical protein